MRNAERSPVLPAVSVSVRITVVFLFLMMAALMLANSLADGQKEAQDVAAKCILKVSVSRETRDQIMTASLNKWWDGGMDGILTVTLPGSKTAQGIMLSFYRYVPSVVIESLDSEEPEEIARYTLPYFNDYIPFSRPVHSFRIRNTSKDKPLQVNRLNVLTEGLLPDWVQRWEPSLEQADIQLIVTHPDDEVLWFGGLLPTYAGELGKKVQVTFLNIADRYDRKNEVLDALWLCGVRNFPHLPPNRYIDEPEGYVLRRIRQTKAKVIVTQDVNGEYGSESHKLVVAAVIKAVTQTASAPEADPESAAQYGLWQPQKLYVHLWKENESVFNWTKRLPNMGNKTGYQIAVAAFKKHMSQQKGRYQVLMEGAYDCRRLGLYFTLVGPDDTEHPDLLQNIE